MSINGITFMKAATGITVTAGTAAVFEDDGLDVKTGIHVVDTSEPNFMVRPHATFKNRGASLQADGTFSKGIRNFNLTIPLLDPVTGVIHYPVFRGAMEIPPIMTVAQITELRRMAAQQIIDAELDAYYIYGTVK